MLSSQTPTLCIIIIIVTLACYIITRIFNRYIFLDVYVASQYKYIYPQVKNKVNYKDLV